MLALIMAGGKGTRLGMGEKPLVRILDRPMIDYIVTAFEEAGHEAIIALSDNVPMTKNWCRVNGVEYYCAGGLGYVEDLIEFTIETDERSAFLTCASDIPGITSRTIDEICRKYSESGKDSCSVWIPEDLVREISFSCNYREKIEGVNACPTGLNIVKGSRMKEEQDELKVISDDISLGYNINTPEELSLFEKFMISGRKTDSD
ncbi:NTP transferase domain-containing protein [Methanoplanus endosymbiosus]|uniref:NTP transferase domain-containing protein n=1 Tax=Methanoplanus endosymbiosus TaxID=33865 RepID=A0A9E7TIE9_9EURY|nr:NTP transferase domain-containing protein [Methanoplanus endosymbiosus]UUX92353.1 NTP transferase domain-containing protein [Methanoplanus endosymbiosus]